MHRRRPYTIGLYNYLGWSVGTLELSSRGGGESESQQIKRNECGVSLAINCAVLCSIARITKPGL